MQIVNRVLAMFLTMGFLGWSGFRSSVSLEEPEKVYKNVIVMIGDGMGENTLNAALAKDSTPLKMATMPVRGQSETNSWLGLIVTDSAAGGTALSCGLRTVNNEVGVYALDPFRLFATPKNLTEVAMDMGKSTGVITTDKTSGATPASFSAHTHSRGEEESISKQQLESEIDLIWGAASASINAANAKENGRSFVDNKTDWKKLNSSGKSVAQFSLDDFAKTANTKMTPTLEEMTVKAIDILDDNDKGFFLMVEAAHIDKFSHSNDFEGAIHHVREFDKAIAAAMDYADKHPDTLILVTADHETGGIQLRDGEYVYTRGDHSTANVPVFVNRSDVGFYDGGVWKNRQISFQLALAMGVSRSQFPAKLG